MQLEVPLPNHPQLIPADLLIKNWEGSQNLALDFTIVSPSLRISEGNIANLETGRRQSRLDQAAQMKHKKYKAVCDKENWQFLPVVADTYGAFRADARKFLRKLIGCVQLRNPGQAASTVAAGAWTALAGAAVSRAAGQLARATESLVLSQVSQFPSSLVVNMGNVNTLTRPSLHQPDEVSVSSGDCEDPEVQRIQICLTTAHEAQ